MKPEEKIKLLRGDQEVIDRQIKEQEKQIEQLGAAGHRRARIRQEEEKLKRLRDLRDSKERDIQSLINPTLF